MQDVLEQFVLSKDDLLYIDRRREMNGKKAKRLRRETVGKDRLKIYSTMKNGQVVDVGKRYKYKRAKKA